MSDPFHDFAQKILLGEGGSPLIIGDHLDEMRHLG